MEGVELMEDEVFKQIIGYENYYISNRGRCWNNKTKRFIGTIDKITGFINVNLYNAEARRKKFQVRQLVNQYFGNNDFK